MSEFECRICHNTFTTEKGLKIHIAHIHKINWYFDFNTSLREHPDNDSYYKKRQYAYKIINSALLQYDLELLAGNYKIKHRPFDCIKRHNVVVARTYFDSNLKYFEIHLPLDQPNYCIKRLAIHEISHIIERVNEGISYDSTVLGHSRKFYDICKSIDPNFIEDDPCVSCFRLLRLLVCNESYKDAILEKYERRKILENKNKNIWES